MTGRDLTCDIVDFRVNPAQSLQLLEQKIQIMFFMDFGSFEGRVVHVELPMPGTRIVPVLYAARGEKPSEMKWALLGACQHAGWIDMGLNEALLEKFVETDEARGIYAGIDSMMDGTTHDIARLRRVCAQIEQNWSAFLVKHAPAVFAGDAEGQILWLEAVRSFERHKPLEQIGEAKIRSYIEEAALREGVSGCFNKAAAGSRSAEAVEAYLEILTKKRSGSGPSPSPLS